MLLRSVDEKGDIYERPDGLAEAKALGAALYVELEREIKEVQGGG